MSQVVVLRNVPEDQVADMEEAAKKLGGSDIQKTDNGDHTFDLEVTFPD
jgi:hypothetical protein